MKKDVAIHVKHCKICARNKNPPNQKSAPLKPIVINEPLEKVSMDFVSPLPRTKNGNQWILVLSDFFTQWPVACALPSSSAELVAQKLVAVYMWALLPTILAFFGFISAFI